MKRRKLKSYRPDVGLYLCTNSGNAWYEVINPAGQTIKCPEISVARNYIKRIFGPELKKETQS